MKKLTKFFIIALASILVSSAAFADDFDWADCWCTYGGGLKEGDKIINIGGGFSFTNSILDNDTRFWLIPTVEASFEIPVMIWKLPFSFGGSAYYGLGPNMFSTSLHSGAIGDCFIHSIASGGMVKYHLHLPPENLDLYAGMKIGFGVNILNYSVKNSSENNVKVAPTFYASEFVGATWYFADSFGLNAEFGYPILMKIGVSCKF